MCVAWVGAPIQGLVQRVTFASTRINGESKGNFFG